MRRGEMKTAKFASYEKDKPVDKPISPSPVRDGMLAAMYISTLYVFLGQKSAEKKQTGLNTPPAGMYCSVKVGFLTIVQPLSWF
jgi:hypothetical protein